MGVIESHGKPVRLKTIFHKTTKQEILWTTDHLTFIFRPKSQWRLIENEKISREVRGKLWNFMTFNPLTPEIWSLILLSSFYIFPCKLVMRIWCWIKINFYMISLNILITCLLDNVRILLGEVSCWSLLGVKG